MDNIVHLLIGMVSGCTATMIIQPIDMVKVRLQIKNEEFGILKSQGKPVPNVKLSFIPMAKTIIGESGPLGLYRGLSSALMRQVFYATTRLGLYKILTENHKKKTKSKNISTFSIHIYALIFHILKISYFLRGSHPNFLESGLWYHLRFPRMYCR